MAVEHLYVHIPFCRSRCEYCDFSSEAVDPVGGRARIERYFQRLHDELAQVRSILGRPIKTVYVGGGTPTVVPRELLLELVGTLAELQRPSPHQPGAALEMGAAPGGGPAAHHGAAPPELTVEANPGTLDASLLTDLRTAGATRLSLGVQSFSPRLREALGRRVTQDEVEDCLAAIRDAGWRDWNLDLIHGIPGATWADASTDVQRAVEAAPTHISLYDLTYTPRYETWAESILGPDEVRKARAASDARYSRVHGLITAAGFERYEVSNFARAGHECRHNLAYWDGRDYVGIGTSAVSTVGGERRCNPATVDAYLSGARPEVEPLDTRTRLWEKAMLGLRTTVGVDEEEVRPVLDPEAEKRLLDGGYLERRCGKLRLNPGFLDLGNSVISALLASP